MGKYDFELDLYDDNTIAWIANRITENSSVLEFGSANGRLTKYLSESKKCKVDIVEIDEESGKDAARFAEHAWVGEEKGDIEKYFWLESEQKYDYIVFADVLEHLVHARDVLDKCKNVLNENGKVLVSVPNIAHNSIIIDLINGRFHYNPTGIMDNTHVRFFTRESFAEMASQVGWTIAEEKAKNIRVGETEIKNTYADVSKETAKELMARPEGNVYQYMFVLALNGDFVQGKCEQIISLDSTSYYKLEIQYQHDGIFDYAKSVSRQINPYYGTVKQKMTVLENEGKALIKLLNTNCVVEIRGIQIYSQDAVRKIEHYQHNGYEIGEVTYFIEQKPEIQVELLPEDREIEIEFQVYQYDFEDVTWKQLYDALLHEQQHIGQVCADYEAVVKDKELQIQNYETTVEERDLQIQSYEAAIKEKDAQIEAYQEKQQQLEAQIKCMEDILTERQKKRMHESNQG